MIRGIWSIPPAPSGAEEEGDDEEQAAADGAATPVDSTQAAIKDGEDQEEEKAAPAYDARCDPEPSMDLSQDGNRFEVASCPPRVRARAPACGWDTGWHLWHLPLPQGVQ